MVTHFSKSASILVLSLVGSFFVATPAHSAGPTKTVFTTIGVCAEDSKTARVWREFQRQALSRDKCARPYRFQNVPLRGKPETSLLQEGTSKPFCDVQPSPFFMAGRDKGKHLNPSYRIHVVGISDSKHKSSSSPGRDYKDYFKFLLNGLNSITDAPSNYQITFSSGYKQVSTDFKDRKLGFANATKEHKERITQETIDLYDSEVDFSSFDKLFIFVPPTVSRDLFVHGITSWRTFSSDEGDVPGPYLGGRINDFKHRGWLSGEPFGLIHELFHVAGGVSDDHYGAWPAGTPKSQRRGPAPGGTGNWGNMSGGLMDWLAWDKYLARMIGEDQIHCSTGEREESFWLRPSTHQTTEPKLLLIKTGATTAVAIESIRASGFSHKIPTRHHGALVYTIDTSIVEHGLGVEVVRPPYRKGRGWASWRDRSVYDFHYADAALKSGEALRFSGFKIEVIESGSFGDVVRVSPTK
jgi:hypothetical protein